MTVAAVLIVDDDEDVLEALGDLLTLEGHDVRLAHDGIEGLERLASQHFDLILLDVEMPRLSGPEMAVRMLVRDAGLERIPIVLLSGKLGLDRVAKAVGTPYFLAKPYTVDQLADAMERALTERAPPRPAHPAHSAQASRRA